MTAQSESAWEESPGEPATRRRSQLERRTTAEQALLDSAAKLFAQRGVDQTSLAQVGEQAGYSRGLVNHHFGSKAALVERLVQRSQKRFVDGMAEFEGNDVETIIAILKSYFDAIIGGSDETRAYFVMWGAALPLDADLRPSIAAGDQQLRSGLASLVVHGQNRNSISAAVDPVSFSTLVAGMLRGVAAQYMVDPASVDLIPALEVFEKFVRDTLSPQSP